MDEEKKQESLMGDLKSYKSKSLSGNLLAAIVVLSLVSGAVGGAFGASYASQSPQFKKYFSSNPSVNAGQNLVLNEDSAIIDTVKKTSPAVVSVVVSKDLSKIPGFGSNPFGQDPFFQMFGLNTQAQPNTTPNVQQIAAGSGFFISQDGTILTNKHVVADESASYSVVTSDGKTYDAKVLTRDPVGDLAIIKIDITNAPILEFADSTQIQIGQRVVAIGNSLGQYQNTVTSGIVSGIGRSITAGGSDGSEELQGVIQTDAAINPGNSGGPLLNILGQVIGINTAIDNGGQLVGFAIPSVDVQKAVGSFKKYGRIARPFLGVRYIMINKDLAQKQKLPRDYGALILRGQNNTDFAVLPGSPADKAHLTENDIILEVNGTKVDDKNSLAKLLSNFQIGDVVNLKVYSKGSEKDVKVTLEENKQ